MSIDFVETGLHDLDVVLGGLERGQLTVLAGRPSMAKSQLAVFIANQAAANNGESVTFFTLESSKERLTLKFLALNSGIDSSLLLRRKIDQSDSEKLSKARKKISAANLFIQDEPRLTLDLIASNLNNLQKERGEISLIILDYLQLLNLTPLDTYRQNLERFLVECKALARQYNAAFLVLAQVTRAPQSRVNKRPLISDIRESGAIEEVADQVWMLYRDQYYYPNSPDHNTIELIVGKNRMGLVGTFKFFFDPTTSNFTNLPRSSSDSVQTPDSL